MLQVLFGEIGWRRCSVLNWRDIPDQSSAVGQAGRQLMVSRGEAEGIDCRAAASMMDESLSGG
jgi:hypothetical protein